MAYKLPKEKLKAQQDKGQAILSRLLKDDDNKYCVDCDAKGPRWASWNLGIFLCIRCAGIHRNLGAHISKVKSVNLDTWTPEQISMMMEIGNSRARAVYEANIPDGFRRPQTDSSLEAFVRSKYEHKKYIAHEWVPPVPRIPREFLEDDTKERKKVKKNTSMVQLNPQGLASKVPQRAVNPQRVVNGDIKPSGSAPSKLSEIDKTENKPVSASIDDLLGLDMPETKPDNLSTANFLGEIFNQPAPITVSSSAPSSPPNPVSNEAKVTEEPSFDDPVHSKSTKDSIMALYGTAPTPQPQQPYGAYMGMNQTQMGLNQVQFSNMNPAQMNMNPAQMNMNPAQMNMNPAQMSMNPAQMNMNPAQMNMNPAQMNVHSTQMNMTPQQLNQMGMYQTMGMGNVSSHMVPGAAPQSGGYTGVQAGYGGSGSNMMFNNPQQYQYNQMQQQMAGMSVSGVMGQGQGTTQAWQTGPSTLSNNLWQ